MVMGGAKGTSQPASRTDFVDFGPSRMQLRSRMSRCGRGASAHVAGCPSPMACDGCPASWRSLSVGILQLRSRKVQHLFVSNRPESGGWVWRGHILMSTDMGRRTGSATNSKKGSVAWSLSNELRQSHTVSNGAVDRIGDRGISGRVCGYRR